MPKMPQGSLVQNGICAVSIRPRNTGVRASTKIVETKKNTAACRVTSQVSLNLLHNLEGPRLPNDIAPYPTAFHESDD